MIRERRRGLPQSLSDLCDSSGTVTRLTVKRLSTGYYHIRGDGPCNWAQPPTWPCDDATLEAHTFPEASVEFRRDARKLRDSPRRVEELEAR